MVCAIDWKRSVLMKLVPLTPLRLIIRIGHLRKTEGALIFKEPRSACFHTFRL